MPPGPVHFKTGLAQVQSQVAQYDKEAKALDQQAQQLANKCTA